MKDELRELAAEIKERRDAGDTLTLDEQAYLDAYEAEAASGGPEAIDKENLVKPRRYLLSPKALEQRRRNAEHINSQGLQTGPVTQEGKAASSRNAYRHGLYAQSVMSLIGKPCRSTCPSYPCALVEEGSTEPGNFCLDKQHFVEAVMAIESGLKDGKHDALNALASIELATNLEVFRKLKESILTDGVIMRSVKRVTKEDTETEFIEYKPNPALLVLPKLIEALGMGFDDFNATPKSRSQARMGEEVGKGLAGLFTGARDALKEPEKKGGSAKDA